MIMLQDYINLVLRDSKDFPLGQVCLANIWHWMAHVGSAHVKVYMYSSETGQQNDRNNFLNNTEDHMPTQVV
jgi:hypothetical protein